MYSGKLLASLLAFCLSYSDAIFIILGSQPDNGILVAYSDDVPVGYGAAMEDTPPYCDKRQLLLWALYAQPAYSKLVSKALFDEAAVMAKRQGYSSLSCFNGRLTGSSFSFFERVLGMRRRRMEFQKIL